MYSVRPSHRVHRATGATVSSRLTMHAVGDPVDIHSLRDSRGTHLSRVCTCVASSAAAESGAYIRNASRWSAYHTMGLPAKKQIQRIFVHHILEHSLICLKRWWLPVLRGSLMQRGNCIALYPRSLLCPVAPMHSTITSHVCMYATDLAAGRALVRRVLAPKLQLGSSLCRRQQHGKQRHM